MTPGRVSIGYCHPGEIRICFHRSLFDVILSDLADPARQRTAHPFGEIPKECGSGGIVDGRNRIVRAFLDESDAEWLWMVDSDAGFDHDALERLIASADPVERPVVGGLSFGARYEGRAPHGGIRYRAYPTLMMWYELPDKVGFSPVASWDPGALVQVSGTGCHCLLIHRSALERVREHFAARFAVGEEWFSPMVHPFGPTTFSEDLSFCLRLAAADMPVFVDTSVRTTHDKGFAFLDEEFYVAQEIAAGRMTRPEAEEASCPQPVST